MPTPTKFRQPSDCPKNHVHYFEDRHGHHATLNASHFKNDSLKGEQALPLSHSLLKPMALLEKALHACFPTSHLLFGDSHGLLIDPTYMPSVVSKAISTDGVHLTANDVRHMFVTLWRDFLSSPSTQLLDLTIQQASACAADLMLNSTASWNISYDDTTRQRTILITLSLWPKFVDFVREAHLDFMSTNEWDPITIDLHTI